MDPETRTSLWTTTESAIDVVEALGQAHGLPYIATQSDLGDPEPMCNAAGQPYGETRFRWVDPALRYWDNRRLALDSPFLNAARLIAEPIAFFGGRLHCWRPAPVLDGFDCSMVTAATGLTGAIIAPVHLPRGRVGVVVWACTTLQDTAETYARHGFEMHAAALRLIAVHAEASAHGQLPPEAAQLTRREVQCLRWAAKGKTDVEIGMILALSVSTVRFHLRNAATKFGTAGRTQTIGYAASLGFIGSRSV